MAMTLTRREVLRALSRADLKQRLWVRWLTQVQEKGWVRPQHDGRRYYYDDRAPETLIEIAHMMDLGYSEAEIEHELRKEKLI